MKMRIRSKKASWSQTAKLQKGKVMRQSEGSIAEPGTILSVNLDLFYSTGGERWDGGMATE